MLVAERCWQDELHQLQLADLASGDELHCNDTSLWDNSLQRQAFMVKCQLQLRCSVKRKSFHCYIPFSSCHHHHKISQIFSWFCQRMPLPNPERFHSYQNIYLVTHSWTFVVKYWWRLFFNPDKKLESEEMPKGIYRAFCDRGHSVPLYCYTICSDKSALA